ncbi:hypothetical protein HMPREF9248_0518 [Fannyhessea vaginae PB189-T1-4]|jgi:hypothetical protein|uniref:Uncharacterized protein n=1 Tax=Fannyhessea vaginae PB189-T1-4 TaxID=866774 RepID=A0ABN0AZ72_9ACTN|nr:hypothetical protein [Fannyhessea vaginae]EFL43839.1 hypothetical protein HMPREF9248_0518 [Fannyhessea vaginae PB189-T1-4]
MDDTTYNPVEAMNNDENEMDDISDLEALLQDDDGDGFVDERKVKLQQNLDGFASCFPDWDLHPPLK